MTFGSQTCRPVPAWPMLHKLGQVMAKQVPERRSSAGMKAYVMAAGLGTRLRPLTDTVPKCLVPVRGRPMLAWWLEALARAGVEAVLVNVHHLAEKVYDFLDRNDFGLPVATTYEPVLLGTAATLMNNAAFVSGETDFLIIYADVLAQVDLMDFAAFHQQHDGLATMGVFRAEYPERCGIVTMATSGLITGFVEKPQNPASNLANAGLYCVKAGLFDQIQESDRDLGYDVLPRLVGRMYAYPIYGKVIDIGTPEGYAQAQLTWAQAG